ncbi:MAG: methyltransferase domain-containing protein [Sedimentisphaerales bacterium]|nr:methyltransferase domain-containing protein [Sedimentisphaerales bacterium]
MSRPLNEVENDFIEFMAARTGRPRQEVEATFIRIRDRFGFATDRFLGMTGEVAELYKMLYDTGTEADTIRCYQFHCLLHLYCHLAYTYPKPKRKYGKELVRDLKKGEFRNLVNFLKRRFTFRAKPKGLHLGPQGIAAFLLDQVKQEPVVLDYGCGLGYISYEMVRQNQQTRVVLLDVDSLMLDFTVYRFQIIHADLDVVRVTPECVYPPVPPHNICILREVLEHVHQPLRVCQAITKALAPGGILFGHFEDHIRNMYHVSPELNQIRQWLAAHFETISDGCFRKR